MMDVIVEVEKVCLSLENRGNHKQAADLRHETGKILKSAKPIKSNLTPQQRQGLAYFKNNSNIGTIFPRLVI